MRKYMILLLCMMASSVMAQTKVYDKLIFTDGGTVEGRIKVQHPGKDLVFIQDGKETTYEMETILAIERSPRDADDLSGIDDVIVTRGGKVCKGQIVKQLLGKSVYLKEDHGVVKIVKNEEIACQRKEKLNQEQSLFEQTPFLDVVVTDGGQYQGVIVLQDYGTDQEPSFLLVESADGKKQRVEISAIVEMQRIPNEKYTPLKKIKMGDGEVSFNRNITKTTAYTTDDDGNFNIPRETLQAPVVNLQVGSPLVIETGDTRANQQGILIRATVVDNDGKSMLLFSYRNMVLSPVQPANQATVNQILRREYQVVPGYYVFFVPENKKVYVCEVK